MLRRAAPIAMSFLRMGAGRRRIVICSAATRPQAWGAGHLLRVHLSGDVPAGLAALGSAIEQGLS